MAALALVACAGAATAATEGVTLERAATNLGNPASLQRGARLFVNYCLSCHSANFMRYGRLAQDLGLSEEQVEEYLIFTDAEIGDTMSVAMPEEGSARWLGATPPDLSVVSRSRGVDWLYSFLKSYYPDPARPSGWNNLVFENTSMPHVLWELQGVREPVEHAGDGEVDDGHGSSNVEWNQLRPGALTEAEYDAAVLDLVSFLEYLGEPSKLQRRAVGVWVLLFLALFAFLAFLLKREYWKDVH